VKYVEPLIKGLSSEKKKVQSGTSEIVSLLSVDHPELLKPYMELFITNLTAKTPVLRWEAVCTLGNLARVDDEKKTEKILETLYQ